MERRIYYIDFLKILRVNFTIDAQDDGTMCLAIPKKVISVEKEKIIVELPDGNRQAVKSIVELNAGDFCLTQQNVAIERIEEEDYEEIFNIMKEKFHEKNKNNA